MKSKILSVMSVVFQVPVENLSDTDSPDTIENWDSIGHMKLVLALEESCGIRFTEDEIVEIVNVGNVISIIEGKIKNV